MARVTRSNIYSHSYSYSNPHSYSSPSVILPIALHDNPRRSCYLLSRKLRTSDDHCYNSSHKSRFSGLYGYGDGYSMIVGHGHNHYQVSRAAKQDHVEGNYEEEGSYKREEFRWLREEQRWLREEQRWLREEARWNAERDSLLHEISHLKLKIQHLESELEGIRNRGDSSSTVPETLSRITTLLQVLSTTAITTTSSGSNNSANQNQIPEFSEETSKPLVLEHTQLESKSENKIPIPLASVATTSRESKKTTTLRMGAEGEEVQALQEALLSLGFYCGEEDMEYSSFSTGTHRAVQTWQASIGAREDGIMTVELLEMLYASLQIHSSEEQANANQDSTIPKQDKANGVPSASATEVREVQQSVVKKGPSDDYYTSEHRVFLLGENRWEDSSRLTKKNDKKTNGITSQVSSTRCLVCRGEGRLLCMECDGTGEPNVEEQFLDWVEDGTKCPYCEGRGYNVCDVCEGKAVA